MNNPLYHQGGSHQQFPSQASSSSHHQQNYKGPPGGSSSSSGKGKDNFGQGKDNFGQGKDNFGQGKENFGQGKENFGQGKDNFGQGKENFGQGKENFGQGKDNFGQGKDNFGQGKDNFGQGKDNFGQGKDNFGHQGRDVFSGKDHNYHYKDGGTMGKNGGSYKDGHSHGGKGGNTNSGGSQGHKGTNNINGGKDHLHKGTMNHPQHPQHQTLGVYSAWTAAPHPQFFGHQAGGNNAKGSSPAQGPVVVGGAGGAAGIGTMGTGTPQMGPAGGPPTNAPPPYQMKNPNMLNNAGAPNTSAAPPPWASRKNSSGRKHNGGTTQQTHLHAGGGAQNPAATNNNNTPTPTTDQHINTQNLNLPTTMPNLNKHKATPSSSSAAPSTATAATSSTSTSVRWKDQGFELSDFLGQGAMGTVFKCMKPNAITGAQETFAVKRIDLAKLRLRNNEQRLRQRLIREISILQNLGQHDNIVGYIGCFDEKETQLLFIVQEYVAGGELLAQIIDRTFYDPEASYVLRGLVRGLQFLHDAHIAHRDLKPENVLIAKSESVLGGRMKMHDVKIADFGLSKEIATDSNPVLNSKNKQQLMFEQTHQSCVGTPMYVAPEVFDKKLEASFGVDIWACGVILFVMLEGKFPFNETLNTSERDFDTAFNLFKKKQSTPAQNALFGMLKQNPNDRWTTQQILDCGFCKIADRFLEELKTKQGSTAASTIYPVIPSPGGDSGTDQEEGGDGSQVPDFDFGAAAAGVVVCPPASGQTPGGPTNNNSQQGGSSSSKGGPEVNAADGGPSAAVGERRTPKEVRALFETVSVEKSDGQRSGSNRSMVNGQQSDGSIPPFHIPGPVTGGAPHQAGSGTIKSPPLKRQRLEGPNHVAHQPPGSASSAGGVANPASDRSTNQQSWIWGNWAAGTGAEQSGQQSGQQAGGGKKGPAASASASSTGTTNTGGGSSTPESWTNWMKGTSMYDSKHPDALPPPAGPPPPQQTGKNNRSMKPPAFPPGGAGSTSNKRQRFGSRGPAEVGASGEPLQQDMNPNANQGEQVVDHGQMNVNPNAPNVVNVDDGLLPKSSPVNRPYCHEAPMLIRENQTFKRQFWGCHRYPNCTNTENYPVFCMFCGSECRFRRKANGGFFACMKNNCRFKKIWRDQMNITDLPPVCPVCQEQRMEVRKKQATGQKFWGCLSFPQCKGSRPYLGTM